MANSDNGKKSRQAETRLAAQLMKRILIHFRSQMDEALRPQGVTTAQFHVLRRFTTSRTYQGHSWRGLVCDTAVGAVAVERTGRGWVDRPGER